MPRISKTPVLFSKPQYANGYLSQWAHSPFEYDGEKYESMEMWMMVHKARLFQDEVGILPMAPKPILEVSFDSTV
jgi:predicted NAD-dependent protein-ADP-ribosyltransferase YbiA (DUF1768 family)